MRTIVVSGVNIRKGGTLTIMRDCLAYLSSLARTGEFRVVALVHDKALFDCPGVELMEIPWTVGSWGGRLWCEYVTMNRISKELAPVDLWLSLHDTTPRVQAKTRAVYCQTSFPFMRARLSDIRFDPKIAIFTLFTRIAYRINVHSNRWLIVQTQWLREGLSDMLGVPEDRFIVAPPKSGLPMDIPPASETGLKTFFFPATADCHKNFETVCRAASILEDKLGTGRFRVILTIDGTENKYSRWLHDKWGSARSIDFAGFMSKDRLYSTYAAADCLLFPSRVETWGLPITEFAAFDRPMLLADLPYAHETSCGCRRVAFFDPESAEDLAARMEMVVNGDLSIFDAVPEKVISAPVAADWKELFEILESV